ncbi:class I SAM-dependent methyltransferase [Paenibacillus sp. TRM 82003]|nr:class I SAM-dependent methyltransferase [Paenibacillus sp. TRM 82003]
MSESLNEPWYERSFGEDYLLVYKHRDGKGAEREVRAMSAWLQLPEGARVLDLCCGSGRHSVVLDKLGYDVTGVDLSDTLLDEARKTVPAGAIRWLRGDMRQVPVEGPFDAVFNLFTSFGYFEDDAENAKALREIERLLRPGGRFLIDFLNPAYIKANLVPHSVREDGETSIDERRAIEGRCVVKRIRVSDAKSQERSYEERVKLYELDDFRAMLAEAGLTIDTVFGGYGGEPYDEATSQRLIILGSKEAASR